MESYSEESKEEINKWFHKTPIEVLRTLKNLNIVTSSLSVGQIHKFEHKALLYKLYKRLNDWL